MMEKTTRKGSSGKSENERTFHVSIKFSFRQKLCCTFPPLSSCDPTVFSCRQQHVRGALPFSLLFLPRFCMTLPVFFFWGRMGRWGGGLSSPSPIRLNCAVASPLVFWGVRRRRRHRPKRQRYPLEPSLVFGCGIHQARKAKHLWHFVYSITVQFSLWVFKFGKIAW